MEGHSDEQTEASRPGPSESDTIFFVSKGTGSQPRLPRAVPADARGELADRFCKLVLQWHRGGEERLEAERLLNFGQYIRSCRIEHGLSVKQLATRALTSKSMVFLIERGTTSLAELEPLLPNLSQALEAPLSELENILHPRSDDPFL
jgi:ribosome-binding protein aMBF1 (putative translation factor)